MKLPVRISALVSVVLFSACATRPAQPKQPAFTGRPKESVDARAGEPGAKKETPKDHMVGPVAETPKAVAVITLQPPPWTETLAQAKSPPPKVKLKQLSAKKNQITDDQDWLAANELQMPGTPVGNAPTDFAGVPVAKSFQSDNLMHLFEKYGSGPSYLQVHGADGQAQILFDFTSWRTPPEANKGDEAYVTGGIYWAATRGDVLYVAHGHMTYAKSSKGKNAYVTALSLKDGTILWRSRPLVSNAQSFAMFDRVLVTGYGFTAEPDFLYVLDLETGAALGKEKLASGPTWIVRKDIQVLVRTYDHDYVYQLDVK